MMANDDREYGADEAEHSHGQEGLDGLPIIIIASSTNSTRQDCREAVTRSHTNDQTGYL